jgi:hypothetical protein
MQSAPTPEAASPLPAWALEIAKRGGTVSDEPLSLRRSWCATVPTPELGFALFWAARVGSSSRHAEPPAEPGDATLALVTRLERIALGGAAPGTPAFVLSVVSSRPAAEVLPLVERHFRVDPAHAGRESAVPRQSSERFAVVTADLALPLVHTGWVTADGGPGRSAALAVALDVLGEERLPKTLVARSLARRVEAWAGGAPGSALAGFAIEPGSKTSVDRVRRFVDGTLKQLRLVGPSAGETSRAARRLELRAAQIWEHPLLRARELALHELTRGDAREWLAEVAALRAVAPEAVRGVAHSQLVDARRTTVEAYPPLWPADDPRVRGHRLHTVVKGDTLFDLSRRFGVPVAAIARANDLDPGRVLSPGQGLWIPPTAAP